MARKTHGGGYATGGGSLWWTWCGLEVTRDRIADGRPTCAVCAKAEAPDPACTEDDPQCTGELLHGECYGQPACPSATFDTKAVEW